MIYRILFCFLVLGIFTCKESNKKKISYQKEHEIIKKAIEHKYSGINTLKELNIASEIYLNENIILKKEDLFEKVSNHTYDYEEIIYLVQLYDRFIDEYPNIVIPRVVSLEQYCGVSVSEYIREYLGLFFWENPREFIIAMNRDSIAKYTQIEVNIDTLVAYTYEIHSEPLNKDYDNYTTDEYRKLTIERIKDLDIENDFYLYLKKEYNF